MTPNKAYGNSAAEPLRIFPTATRRMVTIMPINPTETDITCDGDNCQETIWVMLIPIMASTSFKELDPQIRSKGWTVRGGETFCNHCAAVLLSGDYHI